MLGVLKDSILFMEQDCREISMQNPVFARNEVETWQVV